MSNVFSALSAFDPHCTPTDDVSDTHSTPDSTKDLLWNLVNSQNYQRMIGGLHTTSPEVSASCIPENSATASVEGYDAWNDVDGFLYRSPLHIVHKPKKANADSMTCEEQIVSYKEPVTAEDPEVEVEKEIPSLVASPEKSPEPQSPLFDPIDLDDYDTFEEIIEEEGYLCDEMVDSESDDDTDEEYEREIVVNGLAVKEKKKGEIWKQFQRLTHSGVSSTTFVFGGNKTTGHTYTITEYVDTMDEQDEPVTLKTTLKSKRSPKKTSNPQPKKKRRVTGIAAIKKNKAKKSTKKPKARKTKRKTK